MSKDIQEHDNIDARGVSPDIPCHTTLCIKCNVFDTCRFSSQEARQIREEQDNSEAKDE